MTRFGTKKNETPSFFSGGEDGNHLITRRRWMPPWPLSRKFRFGVSGRGRGWMLVILNFIVVGKGDKNKGVGWVWTALLVVMMTSESLMFLKKAYSVRLQPLKVRWCARHHPLKGLEMIFFPTQNVKYFWRVFGTSARFVTACPTGGATQHFFLALCRGPKILESPKKENNSRQQLVQVFFGNGGMCVWSFVFQHIYVFWKTGGWLQ